MGTSKSFMPSCSSVIDGNDQAQMSRSIPEDALNCPICLDEMTGRIFQCCEGHHFCERCHDRFLRSSNKCPTCNKPLPVVPFRCRALEGLAQQYLFTCQWESGQAAQQADQLHHRQFLHLRTKCPIRNCKHWCSADQMLDHLLSSLHADYVQEKDRMCTISLLVDAVFGGDALAWHRRGAYLIDKVAMVHSIQAIKGNLQIKLAHLTRQCWYEVTLEGRSDYECKFKGKTSSLMDSTGTLLTIPGQICQLCSKGPAAGQHFLHVKLRIFSY